jgi:hypothetical protein
MSKFLSAAVLVLSCSAANAGSLCPYDTPACRMMPDRYIAPPVPPVPQMQYIAPQIMPDGTYRSGNQRPYGGSNYIAPQIMPDGSYR